MIPNQQNQKERKPEMVSKMKKAHVIIPLIIVLMLMCIIPTIILILGVAFDHPTETAELDKNVEQSEEIKAAAVQSGKEITIEENGVYIIKLHGGAGAERVVNAGKDNEEKWQGDNGSLTIGYMVLNAGDVLTTKSHSGGGTGSGSTRASKGGNGISVYLNNVRLGYASGGPGASIVGTRTYCGGCSSDEDSATYDYLSSTDYEMIGWEPSVGKTATARYW